MGDDALSTQGARESATLISTLLNKIDSLQTLSFQTHTETGEKIIANMAGIVFIVFIRIHNHSKGHSSLGTSCQTSALLNCIACHIELHIQFFYQSIHNMNNYPWRDNERVIHFGKILILISR